MTDAEVAATALATGATEEDVRAVQRSIEAQYHPQLRLLETWFTDQNGHLYVMEHGDEVLRAGVDQKARPRIPTKLATSRADFIMIAHSIIYGARRRSGWLGRGTAVIDGAEQAVHELASMGNGHDVVRKMREKRGPKRAA